VIIKAAEALEQLSTDTRFIESGGIQAPITLSLSEDIELQTLAAKTFRILSQSFDNHTKIVLEGGLPALICLLSYSLCEPVVHDAIQTILNLADNAETQILIMKQGGIVPIIALLNARRTFPFGTELLKLVVQTIGRLSVVTEFRNAMANYPDLLENLRRLSLDPSPLDLRLLCIETLGTLALSKEIKAVVRNSSFMKSLQILTASTDTTQQQIKELARSVLSRFEEPSYCFKPF